MRASKNSRRVNVSFDQAIKHGKTRRKNHIGKKGNDKHDPSEFDCYMSDLHHSINQEKERCKSSLEEYKWKQEKMVY